VMVWRRLAVEQLWAASVVVRSTVS
jgi:hypothetical protein